MLKKLTLGLCAALTLFVLVGCGKKDEMEPVKFEGTVVKVDETGVVVEDSANVKEYMIPVNVIENANAKDLFVILVEGDVISVEYSGVLEDETPAQITQLVSMEFISAGVDENLSEELPTNTFEGKVVSFDEEFVIVEASPNQPTANGEIWIPIENLSADGITKDTIKEGMLVTVEYSGMMTMSLPPQIGGPVLMSEVTGQ